MLAGGAIVATPSSLAAGVHACGSDTIRIGLVGCGKRGTAAAIEILNTTGGGVELVAMADPFAHQMQRAYRTINSRHAGGVSVDRNRFSGLDGYRELLRCDLDLVVLATPPVFRPEQFEAAVAAGKHIFMEQPVAIDAAGAARVLAAGKLAAARGLAVQAGFQRRHELRYQRGIEAIEQGAIGDLVYARTYRNGGRTVASATVSSESPWEDQLRNWRDLPALAGGPLVRGCVHQLDLINWLAGHSPLEAHGQALVSSKHDQTSHHLGIEYTYPGGFKLIAQARQMAGCWEHSGEYVHGTRGTAELSNGLIRSADGQIQRRFDGRGGRSGSQRQHDELISALRRGERLNQTEAAVLASLTAIMGEQAGSSRRRVVWEQALG